MCWPRWRRWAPRRRPNRYPQPLQPVRPPQVVRPAPVVRNICAAINELGRTFNGRVESPCGRRRRLVGGLESRRALPAAEVSKVWSRSPRSTDRQGRVRLDDKVTLTRSDLTLFHQRLRRKSSAEPHDHAERADVEAITRATTPRTTSDRSVGGAEAVRNMIVAKRLGAIRSTWRAGAAIKIAASSGRQLFDRPRLFTRRATRFRIGAQAAFDRYVETRTTAPRRARSSTRLQGSSRRLLSPDSTRRCCRHGQTKPARTAERRRQPADADPKTGPPGLGPTRRIQ